MSKIEKLQAMEAVWDSLLHEEIWKSNRRPGIKAFLPLVSRKLRKVQPNFVRSMS